MSPATISTRSSGTLQLGKPVSSGGQAELFMVRGEKRVAKIYHGLPPTQTNIQRDRLSTMMKLGPPSNAFVWPLDIIERPSLGYVMEYVDGYKPLGVLANTEFLNRVDLRTRLRICYRLVDAFEKLHQKTGYAYCDLSGNNILCDIRNGDIRIIDNDNLWVEGVVGPSGVSGTYRCMAPEIESGAIRQPNVETDLHSLAVLIFITLLFHHPLIGDKVHDDSLLEQRALGSEALYIYHPKNRQNAYTKYQEYGGVSISMLPPSLAALFGDAFVTGLHNPRLRVRETNWKRELTNRLDTLVRCPNAACIGRQTYLPTPPAPEVTCNWCRTKIRNVHMIKLSNPSTGQFQRLKVVYDGDVLSAHHCKLNQTYNFSSESCYARVEHDPAHGLTLRNISSESLTYYQPGDPTPRPFPPDKRVRLQVGYRVLFGGNGLQADVLG